MKMSSKSASNLEKSYPKKLKHKVAEIEGVMEIRIQAEFIS